MNFKQFISSVSAFAVASSVFAGLAVTASAETNTLYERGYDTEWSADNITGWTGATLTNNGATAGSGNGSRSASYNGITSPKIGSILNIKAQWYTSTTTGDNGNYSYLKIGNNIEFRTYQQAQTAYLYAGGTEYKMDGFALKDVNRTNDTISIDMVVNTATNTITSVNVTSGLDNSKKYSNTDILIPGGTTFNTLEVGSVRVTNNIGGVALKAISIVEETQDVETANYTVKFVDEDGTDIKDFDTRQGVVGNPITLQESDKVDFTQGNQKYIYVSDDSADKTITSDNKATVTVKFRKAAKYNYTVNTSTGKTLAQGSDFEGNTITTNYPRYINVEGTLYKKDANNQQYKDSFVLTSDNQIRTLEYAKDVITNVAYYSEAEDVAGLTKTSDGNIDIRSSQAAAAYAPSNVTLTSLQPGKYKVYGVVFAGNSNGVTLKFKLGDNEFEFKHDSASNWEAVETKEDIEVTENSNLVFLTSGGNNAALDFIYVVKTGDVEVKPTTHDEGFKFNTGIEEAKANFTTLVIDGTESDEPKSSEVNITDQLSRLSGEGDVLFSVLIKDLPENVKITSITLK